MRRGKDIAGLLANAASANEATATQHDLTAKRKWLTEITKKTLQQMTLI